MSTSGSGAGGVVHGTGWESTKQGLSPCRGVPMSPVPSACLSHACLGYSLRCAAPGRFVTQLCYLDNILFMWGLINEILKIPA